MPSTRFSIEHILPAIKSTSRLRLRWSSFSIMESRMILLSNLASTINPVPGSGSPLTVTKSSKLCPCRSECGKFHFTRWHQLQGIYWPFTRRVKKFCIFNSLPGNRLLKCPGKFAHHLNSSIPIRKRAIRWLFENCIWRVIIFTMHILV